MDEEIYNLNLDDWEGWDEWEDEWEGYDYDSYSGYDPYDDIYFDDIGSADISTGMWAAMGAFIFVYLILIVAFYVYYALTLQVIAKKTGTENGWLAWIPIANFVLMLQIAQKPMWWIILMFIPFANIVVAVMVWMAIAEARGKPNWWGIMVLVPIMNIVMPGYLAWSKDAAGVPPAGKPEAPKQDKPEPPKPPEAPKV